MKTVRQDLDDITRKALTYDTTFALLRQFVGTNTTNENLDRQSRVHGHATVVWQTRSSTGHRFAEGMIRMNPSTFKLHERFYDDRVQAAKES